MTRLFTICNLNLSFALIILAPNSCSADSTALNGGHNLDQLSPPSKKSDSHQAEHKGMGGWLEENVWIPAVNGSGVLQVYNSVASKPVELQQEKGNWVVQTVSSAAGAIIPYVVAGKLAGPGTKLIGEALGGESYAAKFLASDSGAQIVGAGLYEAAKKPSDGETRLGNSFGTMASFALFEKGNSVLKNKVLSSNSQFTNIALKATARAGVGALGGVVNYDGSHFVANLQGVNNQTNWNDRISAIASGGLINVALPAVQQGVSKAIESTVRQVRSFSSEHPATKTSVGEQPHLQHANAQVVEIRSESQQAHPSESQQANPTDSQQTNLPEHAKIPAFDVTGPLGSTVTDQGIQFAVYSEHATGLNVLIFNGDDPNVPSQTLPMTRTGNIWHVFGEGLPNLTKYLYETDGNYTPDADGSRFNEHMGLLDPYSKANTGDTPGPLAYDNTNPTDTTRFSRKGNVDDIREMPKSIAIKPEDFDWKGDKPLHTPIEDTNIYEVNLRGYTAADSSLGEKAGKFAGFQEKIPFVRDMGYTAVEFMPIMESDHDIGLSAVDPVTGQKLGDSWRYNPVGYQAPDGEYAVGGTNGQQINQFKTLVREMHANGLEVILDIVFNHTREGGAGGPTINFKGLDNKTYYMLNPNAPDQYVDHTGCGDTLNVNHPAVQKMILDTLRYWVEEMHVDGFRFDLAPIFNYDVDGQDKVKPPIIAAIEQDPVLKDTKMIAEPWSIDQYKLGHFSDQRWGEWNGSFRDIERKFTKGDSGQTAALADRIAGSPGWFDSRTGRYSVNFIACHDGFTMRDLVSYNEKHNEINGEQNRDGSNDNYSWNSGVEGPTESAPISDAEKAEIEALREKQTKNMAADLYLSRGVPMLLYGDEMGRTAYGDNNAWNNDRLNNLDWSLVDKNAELVRFFKTLIASRKDLRIGHYAPQDLKWHGTMTPEPDFSDGARFIAPQFMANADNSRTVFNARNAYWEPITLKLPEGFKWHRFLDTSLPSGEDIVPIDQAKPVDGDTYVIQPRSRIAFFADTSPEQKDK